MTRLFVYGTLMHGESNHAALAGSRCLGTARTRAAFTLHDLGAYPALAAGGSLTVAGELYEVAGDALAAIDRLEGHPFWFRREPVVLDDGTDAEAYLVALRRLEGRPVIASGSWRERGAGGTKRRQGS
ncbi:MAG: gamma-glutamylcyclotransferase family protein [Acidobacteriota bacterium]